MTASVEMQSVDRVIIMFCKHSVQTDTDSQCVDEFSSERVLMVEHLQNKEHRSEQVKQTKKKKNIYTVNKTRQKSLQQAVMNKMQISSGFRGLC